MLLVTGGTGFIGSHLLSKLAASGQPARCLTRQRGARFGAAVEPVYGDLTTGEGLETALRDVTTVVHLAGVTKALHRDDYYSGNLKATENLASALAGSDIRLVHVSSLAAVGPSHNSIPVSEDADPHPLTQYGRSKLEAEKTVSRLTPQAVIVRPPVVYGPRDRDVFQVLRSISKGLMVAISGGERWFSAIYADDLAEGLLAAAQSPVAAGRTYFLAHHKPVSWGELAATAARIMGRKLRVVRVPPVAAHCAGYCAEVWARVTRTPGIVSRDKVAEAKCACWTCDTSRAAAELGFEARTPLETGLEKTLAWYKEAGWLKY